MTEILNHISSAWTELNTLSWPVAVIILAIIFRNTVVEMGRGLVNLSQRVTKVAGVELQQQVVETAAQDVPLSAVLDGDNDLANWTAPLDRELAARNFPAPELKTRLVRAFAFTNRARAFDGIMHTIYNSQVEALKKLSSEPMTKKGFQRYYQTHVERATAAGLAEQLGDIDNWIRFLQGENLMAKDNPGSYFRITDRGRAFLTHVAATPTITLSPF